MGEYVLADGTDLDLEPATPSPIPGVLADLVEVEGDAEEVGSPEQEQNAGVDEAQAQAAAAGEYPFARHNHRISSAMALLVPSCAHRADVFIFTAAAAAAAHMQYMPNYAAAAYMQYYHPYHPGAMPIPPPPGVHGGPPFSYMPPPGFPMPPGMMPFPIPPPPPPQLHHTQTSNAKVSLEEAVIVAGKTLTLVLWIGAQGDGCCGGCCCCERGRRRRRRGGRGSSWRERVIQG